MLPSRRNCKPVVKKTYFPSKLAGQKYAKVRDARTRILS